MSLTSRLDGFEGRFLHRWVTAWIAMLLVNCVILLLFIWLDTLEQPGPELADAATSFAAIEGLVFSMAFILTPMIAWMVLKGAYPRPSLAVWIGCMAVAMVVFFLMYATIILTFAPQEGSNPNIGIATYVLAYNIDMTTKLGFILAFLMHNWRVGWSLAVTFSVVTFALALVDLSSGVTEVIWALETYSDETERGGIAWTEYLAWSVESFILGVTTGLAIIYGNRWHVRDVDDRVFD